jgi:hypothetical protein
MLDEATTHLTFVSSGQVRTLTSTAVVLTDNFRCFPQLFQDNGNVVNVHYEPPEDGLVKAETYVGVEE